MTAPTFTDAAGAYFALAELREAMNLGLPWETFHRLQAAARAAQAWIEAHPDEARWYRIRGLVAKVNYAQQEIAAEADHGRRVTLALMLGEAADDLAGEARDLEQAERDAVADADRRRRLEAEQAARALPRRADDELLRRIA